MGEHVNSDIGACGGAIGSEEVPVAPAPGTSLLFARALNVLKEHGLTAAIVVLLLDASGAFSTAVQMGGSQLCGL